VKDGRLELDTPADWPDRTEVLIEPATRAPDKIGIEESEWRDDPASLADREVWIKSIELREFTPDEVKRMTEFDELWAWHQRIKEHTIASMLKGRHEGAAGSCMNEFEEGVQT
jgi:hypothetical protein